MKKISALMLTLALSLSVFSGCGEEEVDNEALNAYKTQMDSFFTELSDIDEEINGIDPESTESIDALFEEFDKLEVKFAELAAMEVPTDLVYYESIESLSDEASDYMVQANEYLHESFSDTSYNEYTLEASLECYNRANKRIQYIISLIHGELPQDDNITYN